MPDDPQHLADVLARCRPALDASLLDEPRYQQLHQQCQRLPVPFSAFWGLEAPLGDPAPAVDLLIEVRKHSARHRLLSGESASTLDALCDRSAPWTALRTFARAWESRDDAVAALIRNVWVEFDLIAAERARVPLDAVEHPSVFWGPEPDARGNWTYLRAILGFIAEHFADFPDALPLEFIEGAMATLPDGGQVFQLGAMKARGDVMLRLCINHVAHTDMPRWLQQQGWPGDIAAVEATLTTLASHVRVLAFDLDYTSRGLGPKLGIECYQSWPELDMQRWQPLLDHAEAMGLIVPAKRAAIARFPGRLDSPWEEQFETGKRLGFVFPVIHRNVHHIKLAFVGDRLTEAKTYLGVTRPGVKMQYPFPNIPAGEPQEWMAG